MGRTALGVVVAALAVGGVTLGVVAGGDANVGASGEAEVILASAPGVIHVYKTPTCGCCSGWVDHLREAGFTVETEDLPDLNAVKSRLGVASDLMSCHTATVDGYVVEGHVPAHSIRKLLAERPEVAGIAVPGMPIGSPGMEGPNPETYDVVAFDASGSREVFDRIVPGAPTEGGEGHDEH